MNETAELGTWGPWKAELLAAGLRQGPSFVLLLLVLYGLSSAGRYVATVGVPAHLEQIQAGYRELQASHDRDLGRVMAAFAAEQERSQNVVGVLERLVENKTLLRESKDLMEQVLAEVRKRDGAANLER